MDSACLANLLQFDAACRRLYKKNSSKKVFQFFICIFAFKWLFVCYKNPSEIFIYYKLHLFIAQTRMKQD